MTQSWRDISRRIIYRVLEETTGRTDAEIRRALRDAYPFGERRYHPYKVWLDELHKQLRRRRIPPSGEVQYGSLC